ncbi:MAG: glycoside hydrolase family 88 protein [Bacteroidales bacterium]|nr:glycoside hydrolase family 88 protein [Bacteroidales bacterium]
MFVKRFLILALALAAGCTAKAPLSQEVVHSEISRNPEASYIDGQEGRLKWNYTTGLELKAMLDVYCHSERSEESILSYVDAWYNSIIDSTGTIYKYKKSNYSLDHICPGRTLFGLYDITGKEKYRVAMDILYSQLLDQPRTPEGGFWHKAVYPNQMWLDGLYMAQPFYAEYTVRYVTDSTARAENFRDIAHQFSLVYDKTFDPETGLLRHAWDSSHEMFWCNGETGQSAHSWGRALGWYAMALVDVIEILPAGEEKDTLIGLLDNVYQVLPLFADISTGMWYQVLDRPYADGNYLEATCSAMFTYAWLKGCRLGVLGNLEGAKQAYESLLETFVTKDEDGLVNLNYCCEVAGLGGKQNRSGDFDYYINEPVRPNDPKGIGPLIWAALEYERL